MGAASRIGWGLMAFFAIGVALASVRYLVPGAPGASPDILANAMARHGALTIHAGCALTALALGPWQFLASIRRRWATWHRRIGTLYVLACMLGGLSGLALASGTTAGPIAVVGFGLLAIAWLFTTGQAWRHARARRFAEHERWMIRSFALTLAAVTLRLYLPIAPVLGYPFMPAYVAISWLCWVPNLIVAELLFVPRVSLRTSPQP